MSTSTTNSTTGIAMPIAETSPSACDVHLDALADTLYRLYGETEALLPSLATARGLYALRIDQRRKPISERAIRKARHVSGLGELERQQEILLAKADLVAQAIGTAPFEGELGLAAKVFGVRWQLKLHKEPNAPCSEWLRLDPAHHHFEQFAQGCDSDDDYDVAKTSPSLAVLGETFDRLYEAFTASVGPAEAAHDVYWTILKNGAQPVTAAAVQAAHKASGLKTLFDPVSELMTQLDAISDQIAKMPYSGKACLAVKVRAIEYLLDLFPKPATPIEDWEDEHPRHHFFAKFVEGLGLNETLTH